MGAGEAAGALFDFVAHELTLFAAVGLLIGGIDDLAVDLIWIARTAWRRLTVYRRHARVDATSLALPENPGRIAVFIGAWDEGAVIGAMLATALARFDHADYRIYVGVYPNDPATLHAVGTIAAADRRVRMISGLLHGPTTKAECLNRLWAALVADEAAEGGRFKAIVLHDAEDVVHSAELKVFDRLIERFDMVQLPVLPLIDRGSRWVSAHYADEFVESHGKGLIVREAIGASVPCAGVGCAIGRAAIQRMADANDGKPFDADSLTEDYEMGLRLRDAGGRGAFVRLPAAGGRRGEAALVAVRAHFPADFDAAVRQKTRWMLGIAFAGWDRLGWSGGLAERWMRLRDRRAPIAGVILVAGYVALLLHSVSWLSDHTVPIGPFLTTLLWINGALLLWRLVMRGVMVGQVYGWREGLRSAPRVIIANMIAIAAARRALTRYIKLRRGAALTWDKTSHVFPGVAPAE